jgi:hypothetical protein
MSFDDVAQRIQQRHAPAFEDDSFSQQIVESERQSRRNSDLLVGFLLLGLGLIITLVTYSSVSQSGGTYVVAYGPMIVGVIRIFRGLAA